MNQSEKKLAKQVVEKARYLFMTTGKQIEEGTVNEALSLIDSCGAEFSGLICGEVLNQLLSELPAQSIWLQNPFNVVQDVRRDVGSAVWKPEQIRKVWKGSMFDSPIMDGLRRAFNLTNEFNTWIRLLGKWATTQELFDISDDTASRLLICGWITHPGTHILYCPDILSGSSSNTNVMRAVSCNNAGANLASIMQLLSDGLKVTQSSASDKKIRFLPHWLGFGPVLQETRLERTQPLISKNSSRFLASLYCADMVSVDKGLRFDRGWNSRYFGEKDCGRFCVGPLNFGLPNVPLTNSANLLIRGILKKYPTFGGNTLFTRALSNATNGATANEELRKLLTAFIFFCLRKESWLLNFQMYQLFLDRRYIDILLKKRIERPDCFGLLLNERGVGSRSEYHVFIENRSVVFSRPDSIGAGQATRNYLAWCNDMRRKAKFYPASLRRGNLLRPSSAALNEMFGPNDAGFYGDFADIATKFIRRAIRIQGDLEFLNDSSFPYSPTLKVAQSIFAMEEAHFNIMSAIVFGYAYSCCISLDV